jgi:hypothetical protein
VVTVLVVVLTYIALPFQALKYPSAQGEFSSKLSMVIRRGNPRGLFEGKGQG